MSKGRLRRIIVLLVCGLLTCILGRTPLLANEEPTIVADDEEYSVFAAVMFPNKPEIPERIKDDLQRRIFLDENRVALTGIPSNHFGLCRITSKSTLPVRHPDEEMIIDYNLKNAQAGFIDMNKLQPLVPKNGGINLVDPPKFSMSQDSKASRSGVTFLSRPGFNKNRTKAVIQIAHVADQEMGVGYSVYLDKSKLSGNWIITGADLTRRY